MAVKTFCSICESFIKDVEGAELQKLNGREICTDCAKKVVEAQSFLSDTVKTYKLDIEKMVGETKKKMNTLDATYQKFMNDITSLYKTTEAELQNRLKDILK